MSGSSQNLEDELALVSVNESNSSTYDILLKIMALGDTGVGKSCFLVQYVEGRFMMKYVTTVGVDFFLRKLVSYLEFEVPPKASSSMTLKCKSNF